uniref:Actin-related protein 2/3 complex subunit 3 n=1 Tax=Henneguya salminicola TaxID=69463 RepID=A0A6G3MF85_HENSL
MAPLYSQLTSDVALCKMALLPLNTKFKGPAGVGDGSADVIDDAINFFRLNVYHRQYDANNTTDRVIIYLTLYITECLKKAKKCNDKNELVKELNALAISKFDIPGDSSFPLTAYYAKPTSSSEAEKCKLYVQQLRQECSARMAEKLYDAEAGKISKWWLTFYRKKFLEQSLAPPGQ